MITLNSLHRKIRLYCMDNFDYWANKYEKSREKRPNTFSYSNEPDDYDIFPRYQANDALLQGVEEIDPTKYNNINDLKKSIIENALRVETIFTKDAFGTSKNAIEDERKKFKAFVEKITIQNLLNVPDLFYRRKISNFETDYWKTELKLHSVDFKGFWFPKNDIDKKNNDFLVFDEDDIGEELEKSINQIAKSIVSDKYFLFNEDNVNYELERNSFDIFQLSHETLMFDETLNWIIYYSHEDFYIIKNRKIDERLKKDFVELDESMNKIMKSIN